VGGNNTPFWVHFSIKRGGNFFSWGKGEKLKRIFIFRSSPHSISGSKVESGKIFLFFHFFPEIGQIGHTPKRENSSISNFQFKLGITPHETLPPTFYLLESGVPLLLTPLFIGVNLQLYSVLEKFSPIFLLLAIATQAFISL
jgi:hypothetical protein